jgi:hypothetical protein
MRFTYFLEETVFSANELSSRPKRSVVEGPAVAFCPVLTKTPKAQDIAAQFVVGEEFQDSSI